MKHLIFVGAGHAHLYPLSRARDFVAAGIRVTLIAPGKFWYSGMGPGMVSRFYEPKDDTVDVRALVEQGGGAFIKDEVVRIAPSGREIHLRGGATMQYDALSLNVGSEVPLHAIAGAGDFGVPVKPIKNLLALRERLSTDKRSEELRVVVIGGGAAGSEVTANIWHLLERAAIASRITLVHSGDRLLEEATSCAARKLTGYLECLGVEVICGAKAERVREGNVELKDGRSIPFHHLVVASGIRAPALLAESGLPCAQDGSMRVNAFLQCPDFREIFGAGDAICFADKCLPRIGVYAVRQAPVLHANLLSYLAGEPLQRFKPQQRYLLILNLGDGTGLLTRGRFMLRGRCAFLLKDWLDRRFVRRFQTARV